MARPTRKVAATVLLLLLVLGLLGTVAFLTARDSASPEADEVVSGGIVGSDAGRKARPRAARDDSIRPTPPKRAVTDGAAPGDPEASKEATVPPVAPTDPPRRKGLARSIKGGIVDAAKGEAVPGARVYLVTIDDDQVTGAWGVSAAKDGGFSVGPSEGDRRADRLEIRVRAPGYHDGFAPAEEGAVVRLERRDRPPMCGKIAGIVTDKDGRGLAGRIRIDGMDAVGEWFGQWTETAADGSFVLDGVRPGAWRVYIEGMPVQDWVDTTVPEGGEARVHLRTSFASVPEDAGVVRDVRIGGLPTGEGLFARLQRFGTSQFWRLPIRGGRVEFPRVQIGSWFIVIQRAESEEGVRPPIDVATGEGVFEFLVPR